jgi:hypothetical protein
MLQKDQENFNMIKVKIEPVLHKYGVYMPLVYQMFLVYYVYLSQSRSAWHDSLEFPRDQILRLSGGDYDAAAKEITGIFAKIGYTIKDNDVIALSILMDCYATRSNINRLTKDQLDICAEDALGFRDLVARLYPGAEQALDNVFLDEFTCHLAGIRERLFYDMPSDEEGVFQAKFEGVFLADLCIDFARLFEEKYNIRLSTAEVMSAYYIFGAAYTRKRNINAQYRAAFVSLHGINFARDAATRLMRIYDKVLIEIIPMEIAEVNMTDLDGFDMIITDIARRQFVNIKLPILVFDIYRENYLRSLDRFVSDSLMEKFQRIINDRNIIRDTNFNDKNEVFEYLAEHYVDMNRRESFLEDCQKNDSFLVCERKNNIALISTFPDFYNEREIVIIVNKIAFLWDNESVQMILFFNRRGMSYHDVRTINILQLRLLADVAGIAQNAGSLGAEALIRHIAYDLTSI